MEYKRTHDPTQQRDPVHEKWQELMQQRQSIDASEENLVLQLIEEKNAALNRLKEMEFDNWTMRSTLVQLRQESEDAMKELAAVKNNQTILVCLIDGDGAIFSQEYLKQGDHGGRRAAETLVNGLYNYARLNIEPFPSGVKIIASIFLAKSGLESVLERTGICSPDEFSLFLKGFTQAHPLFNVVDVGSGKEHADHKIREHLDLYIRNPQVLKIFFGGAHDNGYMGNLAAAQTTGQTNKLVILKSYSYIAREIQSLNLPILEIPGLFLPNKLPPLFPNITPSGQYSSMFLYSTPVERDRSESPKSTGSPKKQHSKLGRPQTANSKKRHPAPCNFKYLGGGCTNKACPFGHDYDLPEEEIEAMRQSALKAPCRYANEDKPCPNIKCHLGHKCPRGPKCEFYARGQCKFTGKDMHL
ncbi:hypothetical protein CPB86DRAFT_572930 [Serendipita vermifera]|nr:hypothetical protein CPB86DRAFT_572930 [Serendipita vermifera]